MNDHSPHEKKLRATSFVVHATRGIIRDQSTRRKAMLILSLAALALMVCGSTFLDETLNPHEHPGRFLFFWAVCGWLALTAILLAVFDMLMIKRGERKLDRELREKLAADEETGPKD